MTRDDALSSVLDRRLAVKRIAEATGISTAAVSQWRRVPAKHVSTVAEVTGVPPSQLRPDLFPGNSPDHSN